MRKILSVLAVTVSLLACDNDEKGYYITGEAKGVEDGTKIYVMEMENPASSPVRKDSTSIANEKFELDLEDRKGPGLSFLEIDGVPGNVIYIAENDKINFRIYKDSLRASEVIGGKENKVLAQYLTHLQEVNRKMMEGRQEVQAALQNRDTGAIQKFQNFQQSLMESDKNYKIKLLDEHPESFVSVMILTDLLQMKTPASELKPRFENLSEEVKQTPMAQSLNQNLEKSSAVDIGSKAPEFTAPTPDGEQLSLKDAMGKVTLIDFWAAWCKPCRVENPNLVKIYNKYHEKGLNIIGVSLDRPNQRDRWLKAIEDDGLPWYQVSHLQFWQDPVAQLYGIRAIPAAFILDEEGVIVAKNLRGKALENKIAEMLD
ncbi:redoxin domain-containing protein [Salegentibacter sp. HM20]